VGEADFAGHGVVATADEGHIADGVVGGPEGTTSEEARFFFEEASDGVYAGGFQGLFQGKGGQNSGEALGNHRFAGTRGANHEQVMPACGGHFHGALEMKLTLDLAHIYGVGIGSFLKESPSIHRDWLEGFSAREKFYGFFEILRGINGDVLDDTGFLGVGR
jgi:hypothetical protein